MSGKAEIRNFPKAPPSPGLQKHQQLLEKGTDQPCFREEILSPEELPASCKEFQKCSVGEWSLVLGGVPRGTPASDSSSPSIISQPYLLMTPIKMYLCTRLGFPALITLVCVDSLLGGVVGMHDVSPGNSTQTTVLQHSR